MCRFLSRLILAVAAVFQFAIYQALAQKKNVLFIVADDMSRQIAHLKISPYTRPTPNIDALAMKGVSFSNAHACAPECNPSRTCFLYGLSPLETKVHGNSDLADNPAIFTKEHLVAYFKRIGYRTIGGQRIFHKSTKVDQKFDSNFFLAGSGGYATRIGANRLADPRLTGGVDFGTIFEPISNDPNWIAVDRILVEMKANEAETQPAFVGLGFRSCHPPVYISNDIMKTIDFTPNRPPIPANDFNDIGTAGKSIANFARSNAELALANRPLGTSFLRHYHGCISMVDTLLGRLMTFVNSSPDDWLVVFTSDHGHHLLDKILMTKFTLWPQVTQVPLVIYGKGFTGGKIIDTPVSLLDLYPTFEKYAGVKAKYQLQGVNLQNIVTGANRRPVVVYTVEGKAVINEQWHLIRYTPFNFNTQKYETPGTEIELYDRIKDPWALINVASNFPNVVNQLKDWEM